MDKRLAEIIDNAVYPVAILDREGRCLLVNPFAATLWRRTAAELHGRRIRDLLPADQVSELEGRLRRVVDRNESLHYQQMLEADEGPQMLNWSLAPIHLEERNEKVVLFAGFGHPANTASATVSNERADFEELIGNISSDFLATLESESEATTERTLRKIGEFIRVDRVRLFTLDRDRRFLECFSEWRQQDSPDRSSKALPPARVEYPWILERLIAGELIAIARISELPAEAFFERRDFQLSGIQSAIWIPQRFNNQTVGALCLDHSVGERSWPAELAARLRVIANIIASAHERMRAQRELGETRTFTEGVIAATPHICFVFDLEQQKNIFVNSQVAEQLGYSVAEILAMGDQFLTKLVHPDDLPQILAMIERWQTALLSEVIQTENRFRRRDGEWRWLRSWIKAFHRRPDGYLDQIIGWAEDITESKRAEEELRQHRDELARVDRINAMGEMVSGVTHELSQPLNAVTNFLSAARNSLDKMDQSQLGEAAQWLQQASSAASNAGEIIRRLRVCTRGQKPNRAIERTSDLIGGAVSLMQFEFKRQATHCVWNVGVDDANLLVDRVQIQQVLVNLLQNACEAMEGVEAAERVVAVGVQPQGEFIEFSVRDHGIGLPADETRLFERFVTTKPHGLGLGLAISKTIVEEHGGELWAERNPDAGSTFRFTLPLPGNS